MGVKQFLITVAGVLVGLILFLIIAPMVIIGQVTNALRDASAGPQPEKAAVVLSLDLRSGVADQPDPSPFAAFGDGGVNTLDIVRKLDAAARDDRVKGIYVRLGSSGFAPAAAEEIRDALGAFRKAGKFAIAHIQNEGPRQSIAGFAAVSGVDELWLQAAGDFMPMGMVAEETFLADTLREFRLVAEFETREEYKTAANTLTQRGFTPADRESTQSLLTGIFDGLVAAIAADRKMSVADAKALIEATPLTAEDAVARKLIDKLGRPEDAETAALDRAGGAKAAELFSLGEYAPPQGSRGGAVIAVVHGEGPIVTGDDDGGGPFGGEAMMTGDAIAGALMKAANDEDVKAIVFRVSSPGGSVLASDQIWHAVEQAKKKGKKVVVSMGAYAASGGYYVSAGADEIVAWPTTITGSIGVVAGKIVLGGASEYYLKTRTDTIQLGSPLANMWTSTRPFNNAERQALSTYIGRAYDGFLQRVKEGRGFATIEETRALAKGRVWTGQQALERKLVDRTGGLMTAVARAKELAGLKADDAVRLVLYPEVMSPFEAFRSLFGASAESARTLALLSAVLGEEHVSAILREAADRRRMTGVRAESAPPTVR
jgi:protease IV